jgi:hypothetical protein
MYYLRFTIGIVSLTWIFGWVSTVENSYGFLFNNFNRFVLGEEAKADFVLSFLALVINLIPLLIYLGWAGDSYQPKWILFIGATLTSFLLFLSQPFFMRVSKCSINLVNRSGFMMLVEAAVMIILVLILTQTEMKHIMIEIVCGIDIAVYLSFVLFDFVTVPRNCFGFRFGCENISSNKVVEGMRRVMLRVISGFTILVLVERYTTVQLLNYLETNLEFELDINFILYFITPLLVYRSFKRSISSTCSFSLHFSIFLCLVLTLADM